MLLLWKGERPWTRKGAENGAGRSLIGVQEGTATALSTALGACRAADRTSHRADFCDRSRPYLVSLGRIAPPRSLTESAWPARKIRCIRKAVRRSGQPERRFRRFRARPRAVIRAGPRRKVFEPQRAIGPDRVGPAQPSAPSLRPHRSRNSSTASITAPISLDSARACCVALVRSESAD